MTEQFRLGDLIGGEYRVEQILGGEGRSGMGVVYRVSGRDGPARFVLKTVQSSLASPETMARFRREAEAWVRLGIHPAIARAYWVRLIDEQLFVAAEYVGPDDDGRNTVAGFLGGRSPGLALALRWGFQFCSGMQHALFRGLKAHRDVKPENLLVTPDGDLKITDFGLARSNVGAAHAGGRTRAVNLTQDGAIVGTLPYMAPEQFIDPSVVDHRCDIYAFGLVLYQLLSGGRYPYEIDLNGKDPVEEFAFHHLRSEVHPFGSPLDEIIGRCLQKQPAARFANFDELQEALVGVAKRAHIAVPPRYSAVGDELEELFLRAQSLSVLGKPREALAAIDAYLRQASNAYWAWTERGRLMLEAFADANSSAEASRASLAIYPGNSRAWNNLGVALARLGRLDEALEAYKAAVNTDPLNTGALANAAASLVAARKFDDASDHLLRAIDLSSRKQTLLFNAGNLAATMAKEGAVGPARRVLSRLTQVDPGSTQVWHNLGLIAQAVGHQEEAIRCFERVARLDKNDASALRTLAKLYAEAGRAQEALHCCESLLAKDAEFIAAVSLKAQILASLGNGADALHTLEDATRKQPEADTLWFILSVVAEQIGDLGRAQRAARECYGLLKAQGRRANPQNLADIEQRLQHLRGRG